MMACLLGLAVFAMVWSGPALAFVPIGGGSSTHVTITENALLQKVMETCEAVAQKYDYMFNNTGNSTEQIVQACLGPKATGDVSGAKFHSALQEIYAQHVLVDQDFANSAPHHFHSEKFLEGRSLITEGMAAIKANIRNENFKAARETLGKIVHTLQDFYSHSNWVELGNTDPYLSLIHADLPIENIADMNTPTCSDCASGTCPDPILPTILENNKLTSGYMGIFSSTKPSGKCSHGGESDLTSSIRPRGGINKDERRPDNTFYHDTAVKVATAASLQLLEDIRLAAGDEDFLRMMGIARSSVLCFVISTTGGMSDEIDVARNVVYEITNSKRGTEDEPSEYILVPFNDLEFGPVTRTADPDVMKKEISKLTAKGAAGVSSMSYSAIQLALMTAPAYSTIYVFTDAPAKDAHLEDTLAALIKRTKSTVNFFMTDYSRRRRRSTRAGIFNDYKKLALASGGQAIEVSKNQLPQATAIILDTSTSALVTVLQQARNPGKPDSFSFDVNASLKNITIYITGSALTFTLTNPNGTTQSSRQTSGALAAISRVGNLWRTTLNADRASGTWQIRITSNNPYTVKVTVSP